MMSTLKAHATVRYEEGSLVIQGIRLLQDDQDPLTYYYVPPFPRLAQKDDGSFELLCLKYTGSGEAQQNGGLFHALIQFDLPEEGIKNLERELQQRIPGARLAGQVELLSMEEDSDIRNGFEIVSSLLNQSPETTGIQNRVVSSGFAPLLPGSKAAISALLDQKSATLLWETFEGNTSDVSLTVHAYYEASVKAYQVIAKAEVNVLYDHFSQIQNAQQAFEKAEIRKVVDELQQNGALQIEVLDRSAALDTDSRDMQTLLTLITEKLTELMFNPQTGWSAQAEKVQAVEDQQLQGRQSRGYMGKIFGGSKDMPYVTDQQFVLKNIKDIRNQSFYLDLRQQSTIKVPIHTSGNLGGLFRDLADADKYFRIVNLNDPAFEQREVFFQLDNQMADAFREHVHHVAVNFRKRYDEPANHLPVQHSLVFNAQELLEGKMLKEVSFPRLNERQADWAQYEYQIIWSLKGEEQALVLPSADRWYQSNQPIISLTPPFEKKTLYLDVDKELMAAQQIKSVVVDFAVIWRGKPTFQKSVLLRAQDEQAEHSISLFHDKSEPAAYQLTWITADGRQEEALQPVASEYIFINVPVK